MMLQRYDLKKNFPNGDRYVGEATDCNIKDGRGTYFWADGRQYQGEWRKDVMHGNGTLTVPGLGGFSYTGPFAKGFRHGKARCVFNNGRVYEGDWKEDHMDGTGKLSGADSTDDFKEYVGPFSRSERHGSNGKCYFHNMDEYEGEWNYGKRHGRGSMKRNNDGFPVAQYQGAFIDDVPCGTGRILYRNGDTYSGQHIHFVKHGEGDEYVSQKGPRDATAGRYQGNFLHDLRDGKGRWTSYSGDVTYEGQWREGVWHGTGTLQVEAPTSSERSKPAVVTRYEGLWTFGKKGCPVNTDSSKLPKSIAHYSDGSKYEGGFVDDCRSGPNGVLVGACLSIHQGTVPLRLVKYEGSFWRDMRHGKGLATMEYVAATAVQPTSPSHRTIDYRSSFVYNGEWFNDVPQGKGLLQWTGGSSMSLEKTYEGVVDGGVPHGDGEFVWKDGGKYKGSFARGQRSGRGRMQFPNADVYDGEWLDDLFHGEGSFYSNESGDSYRGEWKAGLRHGRGVEVAYGKSHYDGMFADNKRHGFGVLKLNDNSQRYEGEFARGLFDGQGKLSLGNGTSHTGGFKEGCCHGQVESVFPNGNKYSGQYFKGIQKGLGEMKYANGDRYVGEFGGPEGRRHGEGCFYFAEGNTLECTWVNNVLDGIGTYRTKDGGTVTKRKYVEGILVQEGGDEGTLRLSPNGAHLKDVDSHTSPAPNPNPAQSAGSQRIEQKLRSESVTLIPSRPNARDATNSVVDTVASLLTGDIDDDDSIVVSGETPERKASEGDEESPGSLSSQPHNVPVVAVTKTPSKVVALSLGNITVPSGGGVHAAGKLASAKRLHSEPSNDGPPRLPLEESDEVGRESRIQRATEAISQLNKVIWDLASLGGSGTAADSKKLTLLKATRVREAKLLSKLLSGE